MMTTKRPVDLYKEINGMSGAIELRSEIYVVKKAIELVPPLDFKAPIEAIVKADAHLSGRMFDVRGDGAARFRGGFTLDGNRVQRKTIDQKPDLIRLRNCEGHICKVKFKNAPRVAVRFSGASGILERCGFRDCTVPRGPSTVQLGDGASNVLVQLNRFDNTSFIDAVNTAHLRILENGFRHCTKAITLETVRQGPCSDVEIELNRIYDMLWGGIYIGGAHDVGVRQNRIRKVGRGVKRWHGNGIRIHGCGKWQSENVIVEENFVRACAKECIYPPESKGTITIGINDTA